MKKEFGVDALIIDMDGVLYRGGTALPGLQAFITILRDRSLPFVIVTNNATSSPGRVVEKLAAMGGEIHSGEVLTSALATAEWLRGKLAPGAPVLMIGMEGLNAALTGAGFALTSSAEEAQAVVVGMDRELTWEKMAEAALAIARGALFVGTNPDPSFPIERGLVPGNGATLAALEATTLVEPQIIGKPELPLFRQAAEKVGVDPSKILVLGDRLETDILGGQRAGMRTGLLLTGVTDRNLLAASPIQPDRIYADLFDVIADLEAIKS